MSTTFFRNSYPFANEKKLVKPSPFFITKFVRVKASRKAQSLLAEDVAPGTSFWRAPFECGKMYRTKFYCMRSKANGPARDTREKLGL